MAELAIDDHNHKSPLQRLVQSYLIALKKQPEGGLIIVEDEVIQQALPPLLQAYGVKRSDSWTDVIKYLGSGSSTFIQLKSPLDEDLFELIAQYYRRGGTIQMFNVEHQQTERIEFEPFETHLLLVSNFKDLREIEQGFSIRDKVGLIESFSNPNQSRHFRKD